MDAFDSSGPWGSVTKLDDRGARIAHAPAGGFLGYRRPSGVGVRNALAVIALSPAAATVALAIVESARRTILASSALDEIAPLICREPVAPVGPARAVLQGFADHPNLGGVLLVGGVGEDSRLIRGPVDPRRARRLHIEHAGGVLHAIDQGLAHVEALARLAGRDRREDCRVGDLVVGVRCAWPNPALDAAAGRLAAEGATIIRSAGHATAMVADGANLLVFGTAPDEAFGCRPAPCLKLAPTSEAYRRMSDDLDVDCGVLASGLTVAMLADEIHEAILRTASGAPTASETIGHVDHDFAPWADPLNSR